eukprot:TRINITY_DN79447_c0_g1_i1.p1 TRINITY_DN79447_c0_g1~~TRINITY_DN79447_c0_g1_i1.p1  ORF type:complete len:232 (-),score=28.57 TRINITY_DN79447_c0_g1_i1:80-775(-)
MAYRSHMLSRASTRSGVITRNKSRGRGPKLNAENHPLLPDIVVRESKELFEQFSTDGGMSARQLQNCLKIMGLEYTFNQAKDMIYNLTQTAAVKARNQHNQQQTLTSPQFQSFCIDDVEVASQASHSTRGVVDPDEGLQLNFEHFLELLTQTLVDSNPDVELLDAFNVMDTDEDGLLSLTDMKVILRKYSEHLPTDVNLQDDEIQEMLNEVDWDGNGVVSFEDFKHALDTN